MAAHISRRLRKGATTTAVAAAAVAALSASQAPGAAPVATDGQPAGGTTPPTSTGATATGDSPYYTDLPPLRTPNPVGPGDGGPVVTGPAEAGIPATVLAAYKQAEQHLRTTRPGCNLPWQLLAGIGKVESGQARGGRVDAGGTTLSPILGPVLDGNGFANIGDTDHGAYDGDLRYDRAVGPMQFIPSTWASWGQDANGDGRKDPNNIYDAARAAGMYLCANGRDLAVKADLDRAVLSYNQSREYLRTVLSWFEFYKRGTHQVPDGTGVQPVERSDSRVPSRPGRTPDPTRTPPPPATTPPPGTRPGAETPAPGPGTGDPTPGPAPIETVPARPTPSPTPPPSPTPAPTPPQTPPRTPADRVERLADAGTGTLTAPAGTEFTERPSVVARDASGKPLALVPVRFEIAGDTDARFTSGAAAVTVITGIDGTATAPALRAGERTGRFTVRAAVPQRPAVGPVAFTATVTAGRADALARTGDTPLTAAPESEFAQRLTVRATRGGAPVPGAALTAEMVAAGPDGTHAPSDEGPYFEDAQGDPVRTLTGLTTDADGLLPLPPIHADGRTGTFLLRLTAQGGATLTVELEVTAA
ncbi:lytic transglycosylase domain-containing protein [Streptomyces sp. MRC013]|uniref:lytic transglycosylase domain-containing protein n=1 Tax=Streptomyces sp. MRC013 TaxID=2898276 RepID=UPI002026A308|nr:lytic transglycosylase domain-containing protein [Streptomyces sp. MRC013]URM91768.1 lytic transglycosylase domain-containing protein [Streptomyces sp. MRC013]